MNDSIIFDIDGTLWNACPISALGWNYGLKKLGINRTVTAKDIEGVAGHPYSECIEILFPGLARQYPGLNDILEQNETKAIQKFGGVFYDGVTENVSKLAASYRLFIVSNCQEWYLRILLERSGFGSFIESYDCNGISGLPKGQMLARLKDQYSLKNSVYIGDTAGDQTATDIAGMEFIHAAYGFGTAQKPVRSFAAFSGIANYFFDMLSN